MRAIDEGTSTVPYVVDGAGLARAGWLAAPDVCVNDTRGGRRLSEVSYII